MRFLAALFLVVAALTSPVLAQLDTANVQRTEAIGCRLGKRTGEGLGQLVSFWVHAGQFGRFARANNTEIVLCRSASAIAPRRSTERCTDRPIWVEAV